MGGNVKDPNNGVPVKVLLVDDECQQLELRALILTLAGFSVVTACGPIEALTVIGTSKDIDIAVVDYEMPIMNGGSLSECLKSKLPQLNIVLYSAAEAIPVSDLEKADTLIPKGDGITVLLNHLRNVFTQLASTRAQARRAAEYNSAESPPFAITGTETLPNSFI